MKGIQFLKFWLHLPKVEPLLKDTGPGRDFPGGPVVKILHFPLQYSWVSFVAQLVNNLPAIQEMWLDPWVGKIPWRRERLPTSVGLENSMGCIAHGVPKSWLDMTERLSLSFCCSWRVAVWEWASLVGWGKTERGGHIRKSHIYAYMYIFVYPCIQIHVYKKESDRKGRR